MDRRKFIASAGMAVTSVLAGCISTGGESSGGGGGGSSANTASGTPTPTPTPTPEPTSRFQGPTQEDPTYVDLQYRDYTESEIESIKANATSPAYDDLFRSIDSSRGKDITYEGNVQQAIPGPNNDHFALFIFLENSLENPTYVSWTGDRFIQGDYVKFWGEVLGPETYETGAGSQNTIPGLAAADIELLDDEMTQTATQ